MVGDDEDANDEDFEAELARELALLDSKDALSDKEDQPAFLTASVLNTDDDEEEDAEAAEPESLRAWRHMVSARDAQLARFEEELQESKGVGMSAGGTAGGEEAAAQQPDTGAQASGQRDQSGVSAADCVQAPVGKQCARGALDTAEAFDPGGPGGAAAPVSAPDVQAAIQALQGLVRGGNVEHDDTAASQDSSGAGSKAPGKDSLSEAVLERQALYEEYRQEEERRAAERERARQEAEERERREAEAARVRAEAEAQALALAQAARAAQLEAEAEAARQRALAAEQAAQREQERMKAEAARLQERRAAMAAEAAERQRQMQVLLRDVEEGVVADAKRKLAAARIMRAWHRYRASAARASRVALVVAMQAACRARAARRLYRQLCVQRDVMHRLDDAASKGQLAAAQEALEMAESAGLAAHGEVAARVAALKAQAKEAAQKLSAAAADGVALAFRAALDAARRYPHLAGLAEESERVFRARQAAAEAELQRAVEARPISEVNAALELALHMGIPHAALTVALADARRRDDAAAAARQAAAATQPFDAALFRERAERAALLGLQSDVATARLAVERRRAGMAAELQRRAAAAVGGEGYADEVRALAASALALGMEREAAALEQQLLGRQRALVQALRQAAASGDASGYEALLTDAEQLGVEGTELSAVQGAMQATHARVREALGRHAEQGTLAGFREASAVAIRAGCSDGAELAHRRVVHRRAAAAAALAAALQAHWLATGAGSGQQQDTVGLAAIATALQQALGLDKQQRQLAKQPSLRVGCPLPPAVSKLLASSSSSNVVQAAASALWQPILQCIDLGLSVNAGLSLSVALLHCKVQQAEVAVKVSQTVVSRDYWGQPDLQAWPNEHQEGEGASSSGRSTTPEFVEPGRDAAAEAGAGQVARSGGWGALWAWPAWTHQALADLYRRFTSDPRRIEPSGSSDKPGPSGQDRQAAAAPVRGRQAAGPGAGLQPRQAQRPSVAPAGQPLTRAMVTSLAPGLRPEDLVRLDLGLERLSSLAGLGQWCPGLKVLLANSNHLTSLEGLEALPHLSELSVKDNYLAASSSSSPAAGAAAARAGSGAEHPAWCRLPAALRKLRLDSNGLQHLPTLLPALPLLRDLSLADNELRHLDLGPHPPAAGAASRPQGASRPADDAASVQPGPSPRCLALLAPQLSSLDLSGNRLSSLAGLVGCACLTSLDVSRNVLTSLQGVEHCLMLQTLDASANELCHPSLLPWPSTSGTLQDGAMGRPALGRGAGDSPAAVPYQQLRSLKLCRNVLTELHSLPPLPALFTLNLQENQISRLCSLDALPSLQTLDLSFNALQEPSCLQALAQLAAVQRVSCNDNPMAERKEAYETALTAAVPWALERDGEVLSLQQQAAHATAACSRSAVLAMAAMGALTSGTVANLPWGPAQRVLQPAAKTSASAAPVSTAARGSGQRTCMRGDSAAALQRARLLYGVACTAHGAASAAGLPCVPSCSGGWAPKSWGSGAWPGPQQQQRQQQQQQQQQALPGKPLAQLGVQSHYVPGGWLHGLEGSWAASSAVSNATSHAWDAVAAAGLRLPGGRGVVPLAECGGDAVSVMDVWEHDGVHASTWSTAALLDRPPLHGFAAMSSSLGRLRLGTGGPTAAAFVGRDGQLSGGEGRSAAGDRSDAKALASPGVRASGLGGGLEMSKALQTEVEASSIAQAHAHEDAVWSMRRGHAAEASAAALAASWSVVQQQQQQQGGDGEFVLRASHCAALMQEACTAAECMQAAWKARQARRYADVLRSDQHQRVAAAAATAVQAAWRGHRVRAGPELAARRNEAAAERQAAAAADEHVRAVAAARIQAAARGFNVRRRLRAAQQAARYVDADADDFDFEAGADDVLSGLKGVEDFLRAEDPAFMAAAAVAITGSTARQPLPSLQPPQRPSMPAWGSSGAAAMPAAPPPPVSAFSLLASNRPPALDVPGPSRTAPSHSTPAANTQLAAPTQANHSVQAWVESHPGPQIPPSPTHTTTTSHYDSQALETQQQWEQGSASVSQRGDAQVSPSAMSRADSQSISPQNAAAQLLKQQRYREKLEALMQEWGFKDLATAEVYYRRQRRQMQKQVQGKLVARNRDPGVRLKRLQEAVGDRERLRPEDLQKHAVHGPEVHLSRGALQGPPSRQRQGSEQASSEAAGPAGAGGGGGGGGWQQQQQGWQRAAVAGGASVPTAGRQVVSADAALPFKSLHGGGAAAAVSDSGGPGNGLDPPASLTLQPGVYRSPQHRQQHMLPPLPAAPQPRGEHSRRSMAFGAGGAAGTDGDDSDRVSMHSALSDGVLMQRKTALAPLQQAGSMGSRGPPSLPQASHAAGPSGRPQAGPGGARQSVVLPAMPKGPSVNRWVLADGGNGVGAGLLQINATQLRPGG